RAGWARSTWRSTACSSAPTRSRCSTSATPRTAPSTPSWSTSTAGAWTSWWKVRARCRPAGSSTCSASCAGPCTRPTSRAWSTATSSPPTSCCPAPPSRKRQKGAPLAAWRRPGAAARTAADHRAVGSAARGEEAEMVGPVLQLEMVLGSRRNRLHVLRWVYAAWLVLMVLGLFFAFQARQVTQSRATVFNRASAPEVVGAWFSESFVRQQMLFILLLTPAFVAGAVTDEKRRGTLQYLMTSDVEARHIVVGKLVARSLQVVLVLLAGLPLFALLAGFGGSPASRTRTT